MKWIDFKREDWATQQHPPERRYVLVQTDGLEENGLPPSVAVGYLRYSAGMKNCPFFVVPGVAHNNVVAWCDCLGDDFQAPLWKGRQR